MKRTLRVFLLACITTAAVTTAMAQKGTQGGGQGSQQGGQGGQGGQGSQSGQGLPGLSFTFDQWQYLGLPNPSDPDFSFASQGRAVVCYRLAKGNSATQPFVLEPLSPSDLASTGFYRPCGEKSDGQLAGGDLEGDRICKHMKEGSDQHWTPCTELWNNSPSLQANQILDMFANSGGALRIPPDCMS
jgi:hypothetical protein